MGLAYILKKVESTVGIDSTELNPDQRDLLVDYINEAAEDIYETLDIDSCLREVYINATSCATLSLPPFVGKLRAVRGCRFNQKFKLRDLTGRYTQSDWPEKWNLVRIVGERAIGNDITNAAPVIVNYPVVDTDLVITIVGETADSNRSIDNIIVDSVAKSGIKNYTAINKITKNKVTDYNVIVTDTDGNDLALLYADQIESKYTIVDISKYPNWPTNCDGSYLMEVLYKMRLPILYHNEDSFPISGYDDIIVLKTKQLFAEDQEGKEQRALFMAGKADILLKKKDLDTNGPIRHQTVTAANPLFQLYPRKFGNPNSKWIKYN